MDLLKTAANNKGKPDNLFCTMPNCKTFLWKSQRETPKHRIFSGRLPFSSGSRVIIPIPSPVHVQSVPQEVNGNFLHFHAYHLHLTAIKKVIQTPLQFHSSHTGNSLCHSCSQPVGKTFHNLFPATFHFTPFPSSV